MELRTVGRDPAEGLGQQVEPLLDVEPRRRTAARTCRELGMLRFEGRPGGQVVERTRDRRHWGRSRSASRARSPASGRSRGERGRAGTRRGGGSWPRPVPGRPASSSACAAGPRARPSRGRRSGRGRARPRAARAPRRVCACQSPCRCTTSAERTASSRSVSGPSERQARREAGAIEPRRRGRHDRHAVAAAGSGRRSCPGCSAPCRRRGPGPARCRDAASRSREPDEPPRCGAAANSARVGLAAIARSSFHLASDCDQDGLVATSSAGDPRARFEGLDDALGEPRRGPQYETTSAGAAAHRLERSRRAAPRSTRAARRAPRRRAGSKRLPVVPSGSGTSVAAQPARRETSSGKPLAAASLTTSPQGSSRLGSTNAPAWAYHRGRSSTWRKPGPVDGGRRGRWRRPRPRPRSRPGPSPQSTRSQAPCPDRPCAGTARTPRSAGPGSSRARTGRPPGNRGPRASPLRPSGSSRQRSRSRREVVVVDGVVAQGDPVRRHAELHQVIAVRRAADEAASNSADPPPLDQLLPPDARAVDRLALGHQDRRPPVPSRPIAPRPSTRAARSRRSPARRAGRGRAPRPWPAAGARARSSRGPGRGTA